MRMQFTVRQMLAAIGLAAMYLGLCMATREEGFHSYSYGFPCRFIDISPGGPNEDCRFTGGTTDADLPRIHSFEGLPFFMDVVAVGLIVFVVSRGRYRYEEHRRHQYEDPA